MPPDSSDSGAGRRSVPRRPIAIDLFAGAGGLSLGLEQAGFDVVASVEYDPVHAATHKFNFPNTQMLCADVSAPLAPDALLDAARAGLAAHGRDSQEWDGQVDLVAGGPPCQGFSLIGKRLLEDRRNRLVFHFFRLVSALRPRYFVMENVPGMVKGSHSGILDELIAKFEKAGYLFPPENKYEILNAAEFGVPQERHRLFLIGTRKDQSCVATAPAPTVRPVPKRAAVEPLDPPPDGPTVWDAIGDLPDVNVLPRLRYSDFTVLGAKRVEEMEAKASGYARRLRRIEHDPADLSYPRAWNSALLTCSMRTNHTPESIGRFEATDPGCTESVSRFYKLDPQGLCNTLRAGSGSERGAFTSPRPIHPFDNRVLSNREAARLHSFPDWFRFHTTKWHGFRQIGNAVAPLVGRAVGAQILAALGLEPPKPSGALKPGSKTLLSYSMSRAAAHFEVDKAHIPAARTRGATTALPAKSSPARKRGRASDRKPIPA